MNDKVLSQFDLKNVHLSGRDLISAMEDTGGIGIPAHPGRRHIGLVEHLEKGYDIGMRSGLPNNLTAVAANRRSSR